MLTAHGVTAPKENWARTLGIGTQAIDHALEHGLSMQDVYDIYTSQYVNPPSTPPPRTPPVQATPPGPMLESPTGGLRFRTLCLDCAQAARRFYEQRHHEHRARDERDRAAGVYQFVNFDPAAYSNLVTNTQTPTAVQTTDPRCATNATTHNG